MPVTTTTCTIGNVTTGSTCTLNSEYYPGNTNQFNDYLIACPNAASLVPCGFTFANQQWETCTPSGGKSSIGTVGKVTVMNNAVTVNGNSTALPNGTTFH